MISKQRLKNQLNKRLAELKQQYRDTCNDSGLKGNKIKKTSATVIRSSLKKNICILYLIGELLEQPKFIVTSLLWLLQSSVLFKQVGHQEEPSAFSWWLLINNECYKNFSSCLILIRIN